ncbi:MFS transporter [Amylibacter sp. IMCC11727]|uniref:MFS transporter n=1 Tax=Amylibacter sp. IMCC11727 TaxID=3039851 RepID=UPI00244DDAA4|nr:MFS transporter [Amylibacter sp. IMCC11727]WGI22936.1 MFS transporter [Amylibacter sp. IMCC11727]
MNLVALRSPEFRLYFFGAVANVNALWISRIVIGWLAWDLTHSAQFVGIVAACSLLPTLFGGPFFGVLVDRSDIKRAAYATNLAMIACIAVLLALQIAGHVATFSLILISLAIGTVTAAHHPVRLSLAPRLVKAEDVSSVVALSALNFNLARLISPAIGGVLIDLTGTTTALLVTLVLFLPNLAVLFRLHPRELTKHGGEPFVTAMAEGMRYIRQRRTIVAVLATTAVFSVALRGVLEVLPIIADGSFNLGAVGLGQLGSAVGGGALCAAIYKAMGRKSTGRNALSLGNVSVAIVGLLAMAVLGTTQIWALALFCAAMLGATGTYFGVTMQSMIQADLPDDMRGRVMSIWVVVGLGATALGAFVIGALANLIGISAASLWISGTGLVAILILSRRAPKDTPQ